MGAFVRGEVIVIPFPFSAAPGSKRRPALVVASWPFGGTTDYLLCLISSQNAPDPFLVPLAADEIEGGSLNRQSYIRPTYLFTADETLILYRVGTLKEEVLSKVIGKIRSLFD